MFLQKKILTSTKDYSSDVMGRAKCKMGHAKCKN